MMTIKMMLTRLARLADKRPMSTTHASRRTSPVLEVSAATAKNMISCLPGEYLYVMKLREYVRCGDHILKVGQTSHLIPRLRAYPKGSVLLGCMLVEDTYQSLRMAETRALEALRSSPSICTPRTDLGREWFEAHDDESERRVIKMFLLRGASGASR